MTLRQLIGAVFVFLSTLWGLRAALVSGVWQRPASAALRCPPLAGVAFPLLIAIGKSLSGQPSSLGERSVEGVVP